MTIKWCAGTGALLIVCALAVIWLYPAPKDPPGVKRRWWDNTVESYEERYSGRLVRRTLYGDDGRTMIREETYDYNGNLRTLVVRRPDGKVETTDYQGSVVTEFTLRSPDQSVLLARKRYNSAAVLLEDTVYSNDGRLPLSQKLYYDSGKPRHESTIESSGDQSSKSWYENGQLKSELLIVIQGRASGKTYFEDGKLKTERKQTKEDGLTIKEFDGSGKLTLTWVEPADGVNIIVTVFENGKAKFRQTFVPEEHDRTSRSRILGHVEELNENGGVKRKLVAGYPDYIAEAHIYRDDGTLATVKFLTRSGEVHRTVQYDSTGKNVVSDSQGGEPEPIDPALTDVRRRTSEEDL